MVFQLNAQIPLAVRGFDYGAAQQNALRGLQMQAAERELDQQNALAQVYQQHGAGLAADDPAKRAAAAGMIAAAGPRGYAMAAPILQRARDERAVAGIFGGGAQVPVAPAAGAIPAAVSGGAANPQWEDRSLPRGIRNNNPLNLTFVAGQPGVQGTDGRFGRYNTPEEGVAAGVRQLQMYGARGLTTPEQIIRTWAPPNENNTPAYVAAVSRALGVAPNAPIDLNNPEVVARLVSAMAQVENGRPVDQAVVQRGVALALQRPAPGGGAPAAGGAAIPAAAQGGGEPRMPGMPTQEQFAQLVRQAATGNEVAQRLVQTWAPFMRRETGSEPLETIEGQDGRPVLVPRSQAIGRTPVRIPNTVVNNNPGETSFDRERGKTLAERASDWEAAGTRSAQTLSRLARFEALNEQFSTGALANQRLTAGQLAQRLGIPDSVLTGLGISRDQVAAGEGLRSLTSQMLVGLIGSGGFPAQNFSNADREMLERSLPALVNSPNGNVIIVSILRASAERDRAIGAAWRDWTRQNGESADSVRRFQLERMPELTGQDILAPILQDAMPVAAPETPGPGGRGTAEPPAVPARPRAVPSGSAFSPSRNMWRAPDGRLFNADGTPAR